MCEVTLNGETYKAKSFQLSRNRDIQRQGDFALSGRNAFRAVIFEFEEDMNFLKDSQSITISSSGEIELEEKNAIVKKVDGGNPRRIAFKLLN